MRAFPTYSRTRGRTRRNVLSIGAEVIFGISTGWVMMITISSVAQPFLRLFPAWLGGLVTCVAIVVAGVAGVAVAHVTGHRVSVLVGAAWWMLFLAIERFAEGGVAALLGVVAVAMLGMYVYYAVVSVRRNVVRP